MGRRKKESPASYHLHKQAGQTVNAFPLGNGQYRDVLFGVFNSPERKAEYHLVLGEREAGTRVAAVIKDRTG